MLETKGKLARLEQSGRQLSDEADEPALTKKRISFLAADKKTGEPCHPCSPHARSNKRRWHWFISEAVSRQVCPSNRLTNLDQDYKNVHLPPSNKPHTPKTKPRRRTRNENNMNIKLEGEEWKREGSVRTICKGSLHLRPSGSFLYHIGSTSSPPHPYKKSTVKKYCFWMWKSSKYENATNTGEKRGRKRGNTF